MIIKDAQNLSINAGDMICNAQCPDCVSFMTTNPADVWKYFYKGIDEIEFDRTVRRAIRSKVGTVLFTGKGELFLHPEQISRYLELMQGERYWQLTEKEIQTNGLLIQRGEFSGKDGWLDQWYKLGMNVVSLSVVDVENRVNHEFYNPHQQSYPSLQDTIRVLHDKSYSVRLSVTMTKGRVDDPKDLERVIDFCKRNGIEELSFRPVRKSPKDEINRAKTHCLRTWDWVKENELSPEQERAIVEYVEANKDCEIQRLVHGAVVYQMHDQNVCLTDCLTLQSGDDQWRQIIFYSCGEVALDWDHPAARIHGPGQDALAYKEELILEAQRYLLGRKNHCERTGRRYPECQFSNCRK
ncbi:MAG: hypothetical protein V2A62_03855 [Candidatus Woesearchaeota archaeon]